MARTLAKVQAEIAKYEAARDAALTAQSYTIGTRSKANPELATIQAHLDRLYAEEARLESTGSAGITGRRVVPRDV